MAGRARRVRFLSHPDSVWVCAVGMGASRWMPMTFSTSVRTGLMPSAPFATGATGVIAAPMSVVWVMRRSRSGMCPSSFITARA